MRFPLPLNVTVPGLLFLMGSLASGFTLLQQVLIAQQQAEADVLQTAKLTAGQTAQLLEYLYRRTGSQDSRSEGITLAISQMAASKGIKVAVFVDANNVIRNASQYELRDRPLPSTLLADHLPLIESARQYQADRTQISADRGEVMIATSVKLPPAPNELYSSQVGALLLKYDLTQKQQQAQREALIQSGQTLIVLVILCGLVGGLLHRIVTQRAQQLVAVTNRLAEGELQARLHLTGSDELAQIGSAFDRMASRIQHDTETLQTSKIQLQDQTRQVQQTLQDLQSTQSQLIQTEKMSSLGEMVAGVAHEINNPISFIQGNLGHVATAIQDLLWLFQLYQTYLPQPPPEIKDYIEEIDLEFLQTDLPKIISSMNMGTERITAIVLSLRNFSRLDESEQKAVDLHLGIDNTLIILNHKLKLGIELVKVYGNLPLVECYAAQLNQVFMNILSNAADALNESDQRTKTITITTENVEGKSITIRIADNGHGMPPEVRDRVFNPFFTTKPIGRGTGLGLSIAYKIIEKHNGSIECHSTLGQGTEFIVKLPGLSK